MSTLTIRKAWITALVLLFGLPGAFAQFNITGFTPVITGQSYGPYTVSGGPISTVSDHWCVTNGTINSTGNSCMNSDGTPSVSVTWSGSGTISYYKSPSGGPVATFSVTAYTITNIINMNANQEFFPDFYPFVPLNQLYTINLTGTAVVVPPGNVSYSWQESNDGTNWNLLPFGGGQNYTLTQAFTQPTTYIQRVVNVNLNGRNTTVASQPIVIQSEPPVTAGLISPANVSVVAGNNPGTFTAGAGSNGTMCGGNYTYTWQSSTDNINWTTVGTGITYSPGNVSQTTYLRILDYCGPMAGIANAVINVYGNIQPGTIGPMNLTTTPGVGVGVLTGNPATGGDVPAGYTYTWQSSSDGLNFSSIGSTNFLYYSPPAASLTSTTWFRRQVNCNGQTANSNAVEVLVTVSPNPPANFVKSRTLTAGGVTTLGAANALTALSDVKQSNGYFDGLGRLSQTVALHGSLTTSTGNNTDLIVPLGYDGMGRQVFDYLPFPSASNVGTFDLTAFPDQQAFNSAQFQLQGDNLFYYGQTNYEASPLARVNSKMAPGDNWTGANRGNQVFSTSNAGSDQVVAWYVNNSGITGTFGTYTYFSTYPVGTLFKAISLDENGKQVIQYKDLDGNLILKKVQNTAAADDGSGSGYDGWLCTYYIYDILNNLRCVVQPSGVQLLYQKGWDFNVLSGDILNKQCFRYEYDARNRVIMKQAPGQATPQYLVYDNLDRIVMTQNGEQRSLGQWGVTLYESALDRPVATGVWTNTSLSFSTALSSAYSSTDYPFTLGTVPGSGWELYSQTHYDNYTGIPSGVSGTLNTARINMSNFYSSYNTSPVYAQPLTQVTPSTSVTTQGLVTWTESEVLGTAGGQYIENSMIYDSRARVIQQQGYNYSQGLDLATTQYNFAGLPVIKDVSHQLGSSQTYEAATRLSYDGLERLVTTEKMIMAPVIPSPAWKTISTNSYDAIGRMVTQTMGSNPASPGTALETQAVEYNIRGWTLGVNRSSINTSTPTPFFSYELGYDKSGTIIPGQNYNVQQFNGNVAGVVWKNAGDQQVKRYDYTYDAPSRLMAAQFTEYTSGAFNTNAGLDFGMSIGLDANGNITGMSRTGWKAGVSSTIDALTYNYISNSNQLLNVRDDNNDQNSVLGDFHYSPTYTTALGAGPKPVTTVDYTYDNNGNLTKDMNKDITSISYDKQTNLAVSYTFSGNTTNGSIVYTFDGDGNKLAKTVQETGATVNGLSTNITTTTKYIAGFVYQSCSYSNPSLSALNYTDRLQFFQQEEGRVRATYDPANPGTMTGLVFDYFLKDNLGNTRAVVTEETESDVYPDLTFDGTTQDYANQNAVWDNAAGQPINVAATQVTPLPTGFNSTNNGTYCGSITKGQGAIGAAKLVRVMAGDQLNVTGDYTYSTAAGDNSSANGLNTLLSSLAAMIIGSKEVGAVFDGSTTANALAAAQNNSTVSNFLSVVNQEVPGLPGDPPKAYLHILFFNDQFVFDNLHSVVVPINSSGLNARATFPAQTPIAMKDGYAYIYFSNESNTVVYFDNFKLTHIRGPLLETNDYYPFGETMAATTDKSVKSQYADNKYRYNGKELDNAEFRNGSGLEEYDYGARFYDQQLGRWDAVDDLSEKFAPISPYCYTADDPLNGIDPDGRDIIFINDPNAAMGAGHAAVIIGNSKDGYFYYSLNGTGGSPKPYGESKNPDIGTPLGNNPVIRDLIKIANTINGKETHDFQRFVAIKTSPEEDKLMKAKAEKAASVKTYIFMGQSCLDVQKSAYDALIKGRLGNYSHVVDGIMQLQSLPNGWIKLLPQTFNDLNSYMRRWTDNENYFQSPKLVPVINVLPLENVPPPSNSK